MKAKIEIDLTEIVDKKRRQNEVLLMDEVLRYYGITDDISMDDISWSMEKVKNYSVGMFTVRYKGKLLYRRYPLDIEGLKFKYESPIFNNVSESIKP